MQFFSLRNLLSDQAVLEKLLESFRMSVLAIDHDARVSLVGGELLKVVGFTREESLGKSIDEFFSFDPAVAAYYHRALHGHSDKTLMINDRSRIEIHFEPIRNEEDKIVGAIGYDCLLDDKDRLLENYQERENQLANLLNNSYDGILLLDRQFVIKRSNLLAERMYNDGQSLVGHICYEKIFQRRSPCPWCPVAESYKSGTPETSQTFEPQLGKHLQMYAAPLFKPETGEIIGAFETFRDISDIIEYVNTIKTQNAIVDDIVSSITDGVFITDRDLTILRSNAAFDKMNPQYKSVVGMKCYETSDLDERCSFCEIEKVFETKESISFIHLEPGRDGNPDMWIEHFSHPIKSDGEIVGIVNIVRDITKRKEDEAALERYRYHLEEIVEEKTRELRRSESKMKAILLNSNVPILFADAHQRTTFVNKALLEITGFEEQDLIGRDCTLFYPHEILEQGDFNAQRNGIYSGKLEKYRTETQLLRKDGATIAIDLNLAAVQDEDGSVQSIIAAILDISRSKQILEALKMATAHAEEASIAKSRFLATMSHEIRTPLNGVIGLTDLLLHTDLNSRQMEYASLAQASGKYLLSLINDILDFSKIEAGKLQIVETPFDLIEMVESVIGILAARAQDNNLELCGLFRSGVPRLVTGDSDRIRQILVNIIGNAVKFTSEGGVKLVVSAESWTEHDEIPHCLVRFEVSDTGIGIPEDRIDRLFQSFSQVDAGQARKFGGTGLGLAISKELVHLMGGEIGFENNDHGGSTFWFKVPLKTTAKKSEHVFRHGMLEFKDVRVLVVDENIVLRNMLQHQLGEWGMMVTVTGGKNEALEAISQAKENDRPFLIAIIDHDLEDVSGMELIGEIMNTIDPQETRIILLTPLSNEIDDYDGVIERVDKVIGKPLIGSSLFNVVLGVLTGKEIDIVDQREIKRNWRKAWQEQQSLKKVLDGFSQEKDASEIAIDDGDDGPVVLIAEDNRVNQIVVSEILMQAGYRCEIVGNGQKVCEAVALKAFSLILMDCQMPIMDGFQATDFVRRMERGEETKTPAHEGHVPIIALTANATDGDESRCLEAGMDGYCSKPIHAEKLISVLKQWIPDRSCVDS